MADVRTFSDLTAWTASVELVVEIYRMTGGFPRSEMFGLVSQLRRAAVSIPANVAEGNSRYSTRAYINHVHVALGSHGELRALLEVSRRLGYVGEPAADVLTRRLDEVGRLLSGLRRALKQRVDSGAPDP